MTHKLFPRREEGQGMVEYALIIALVAIVVVVVLLQLGPELKRAFCKVSAVLGGEGCIVEVGAITGVDADYTPGDAYGTPATLKITVYTSEATTVTVSGSGIEGDLGSTSIACNGSCSFPTINDPTPNVGDPLTVTDSSGGEGLVVVIQ